MAYIRGTRIDPRDLKKNTAIGVGIPFNAPGVFNSIFSTKEQIKHNFINLLLTRKGERIENPDFGTTLRTYLFEPLTESYSTENIKEDIIEETSKYIPEIRIIEIDISSNHDNNLILIKITYQILISGQTDTIIVNFE